MVYFFYGETLDEILGVGKTARDMEGFGFDSSSLNTKSKFVSLIKKNEFIMSNICHNIMLDIVTTSILLLIKKVLRCVTSVSKRVV